MPYADLFPLLFPSLKDSLPCVYINFGEEAIAAEAIHGEPNPLLKPDFCEEWVRALANGNYSYGGYMEDRNCLWRGHYMKPGHAWHLGIDYNVPAGTPVHMPFDASLMRGRFDEDQNGGWGGKMIFMKADRFYIFGHLDKNVRYRSGSSSVRPLYEKGDLMGHIGDSTENGGWPPHLHVQAVNNNRVKIADAENADGYAALYAGIDLDFPRPDII